MLGAVKESNVELFNLFYFIEHNWTQSDILSGIFLITQNIFYRNHPFTKVGQIKRTNFTNGMDDKTTTKPPYAD